MMQNGTGSQSRTPRTVVLSVLVVLAMFVGAGLDRILVEVSTASDRFSGASNYSIIGETYDTIRENYVLQADFTDEQLVWGAASGMVEALGDTGHSRFLNPEEAIAYEQSSNNELIGIGISVDITGELPVVNYPMKNSPAMEAGILPGDVILEVDGTDLTGLTPEEGIDLISGEEGTDVTLKLQHSDADEPYEVTITRTRIEIDPVQYAMLPDGVLWLRLDQFSRGASTRVAEGLQWGEDQGMTGVILDLRGNPGGFVIEAMGVASQFLPAGTPLLQEMDVTGDTRTVSTVGDNGLYLDGPLVVLVDEYSASSSEITSSAIMESGRGELVGETTAGTGTVLLPFDLSDGSMVMIGIQLFLTGEGTDIYHVGVVPTHEVDFSTNPMERPWFPASLSIDQDELGDAEFADLEDPQLHYAFDLLQN